MVGRTTSGQGRCGRRPRRRMPIRRSASTVSVSCARRCRRRSSRSEGSTRPTLRTASVPARPRCAARSMRLSELGERGLLAELERRGLAQHIEHDAATLDGGVVVTQDALVEGVHFRLDWITWRDLGWRAAAVNLSDLAASGADPEGLVVTLAAPGDTEV